MLDIFLMTGAQSRMARSLLKWSREKLAEEARISRGTIRTFEDDQPIRESIILEIQTVFDAHGVECSPDGSVKPCVDNLKDFRGTGSSDRFFAHIEKMAQEYPTGVTCRISNQSILSKNSGRNGLTNFDRLNKLSKITSIRCLLSAQKIYLPGTPSFEVKVYPEKRPSIIASEFIYSEEGTFVVEQDTRLTPPAYLSLKSPAVAKKMLAYFDEDWNAAEAYMTSTHKHTTSNFENNRTCQQACC